MMLKRLTTWLAVWSSLVCLAGENLVYNGELTESAFNAPRGWNMTPYAEFFPEGGPDNKPFIRIKPRDYGSRENIVRQYQLTMVPGERYRLTAWIRTQGFSSSNYGLLLINEGWFDAEGLQGFPADTDWKRLEKTFVCPKSKHTDSYGFVCYAINQQGLLDIADIRAGSGQAVHAAVLCGRSGGCPRQTA